MPIIDPVQPVLGCDDVAASIAFYERLGFTLLFRDSDDDPGYAVVRRDAAELHLQAQGHHRDGHGDRPNYRFPVDDPDALYAEFRASGAATDDTERASPWGKPGDTPWGTREFHLHDPDRNGLQFYRDKE